MAVAAAPRGRLTRRLFGRDLIGYAFVAPYAIFLVALFGYPLLLAANISFFDYFFAAPGAEVERPFVGLDNYTQILGDPVFHRALFNVAEFIAINVPLTVVLALVLASALNAKLPFRTFFRTSYYVPYVTASVAVIGVLLWLFSGNGLLNEVLGPLAPDPSWLVNSTWAMPVIALSVTWKQLGFYILLYLAALQNIPRELYEAAEVDGAGRLRRFLSITVPGVRPATTLVVILATIIGANLFTEPYLLTGGGGPNGASMSPVLMMYQAGIEQGRAGYAAAIGVILAIAVMTISAIQRFVLERD
ncbi:MAG: multiple sugar transport system permease protein [Solirubrobacterales bacterium]|nr:multiple sugar transport system permease protein [Solirubrobacterales bacterium]MEA2536963.1 multiple sugar transport system permease protein [Chloroflexota bacterium]